jgi:predicted RNase H-like nuclease (RuvC/YqgF family)
MSDPNRYVNIYIENALGLVHEYINILLKTKTEAKLVEQSLQDRELDIARLTEEVTQLRQNNTNVTEALEKVRVWEEKYVSMKQQVAHMDTMASSFNQIKQRLIDKNSETDKLATELQELKKELEEKDKTIQDLEKELKPFRKNTKVESAPVVEKVTAPVSKKVTTTPKKEINTVDKAKEVPAPEPVKVVNKLSQLKVQKEEEQADDF